MITTPYVAAAPAPAAEAAAPTPASASRLLLWLPVPAAAAMVWLLVRGDSALTAGVADLDPLYGLVLLFVGAVGVVMGGVSLVLAVAFSFTAPATRAGAALGGALWTACGAGFVAYVAWGTATDPAMAGSSTAGDQYLWQVAAAAVTLLPLAAVLLARSLRR